MKRVPLPFLAALILVASLAGCSRDAELVCGDSERYSTADSIPPVRIPDGLTPPDESESLRLPPPPQAAGASQPAVDPCLETPPPFFEERTP